MLLVSIKGKNLEPLKQFKKWIWQKVLGIHYPQEYLCLESEEIQSPFNLYLSWQGASNPVEVTQNHLFLGYKPVIKGIYFPRFSTDWEKLSKTSRVCLFFHPDKARLNALWNKFPVDKDASAFMVMEKTEICSLGSMDLFVYQAILGHNRFMNSFHKLTNRMWEVFRHRTSGNVDLSGNLFEQNVIAYSIPRVISLITVGQSSKINIFPTDLHGPVGASYYVGSLRIGGKAGLQVDTHKEIVISEIVSAYCYEAYRLGKNHMKDLRPVHSFDILKTRSEVLDLPLPAPMIGYRELRQISSCDVGIHRLHCYEVLNHKQITESTNRLSHVHRTYAEYRLRRGLATNYALR